MSSLEVFEVACFAAHSPYIELIQRQHDQLVQVGIAESALAAWGVRTATNKDKSVEELIGNNWLFCLQISMTGNWAVDYLITLVDMNNGEAYHWVIGTEYFFGTGSDKKVYKSEVDPSINPDDLRLVKAMVGEITQLPEHELPIPELPELHIRGYDSLT